MSKDLDLWQFIASRLKKDERVMLLVVAESSGSSPGRAGFKLAIAVNGELTGSIGGGVMEVNLVEQSRSLVSEPGAIATGFRPAKLIEQEHRKNAEHPSGMICSGRQTVIIRHLSPDDFGTVKLILDNLQNRQPTALEISNLKFQIIERTRNVSSIYFSKISDAEFVYQEILGAKNELFIIGGGHCALALSEMMARLDFRISVLDDRPELNTLQKNEFAHRIKILNGYENIGDQISDGDNVYVVVMTLGYTSDEIVIRQLLEHDFKYFGVLGSKAKMKTLLKNLDTEGFGKERLARIHTPIGLSINSHTPEEIAVSIAAEIILVKNRSDEFYLLKSLSGKNK